MTFTPPQPDTVEYARAGTTLSHRVRPGTGTPLVLVPGVMADAATWQPVVDAVELPNPVVTLNRRGRAPSGALGADYSVGVEVADLRHVLDRLGHAHLFGWSYGALVALEAALGTAQVRSVTAYEPVSRPFAPDVVPQLRRAITAGDLDQAVALINTEVSGFSAEYVADLRGGPAWPVLRRLAVPLGEELAAINAYQPALDRYRQLGMPVTLILGALNENRAPYGSAFAPFAAALPQAHVARLPGQGHLAHVEAPADLARAITAAVREAEANR
ncbi:alpha/beta fold hydrolase [Mycolicibacterium neworleansense]|uniref:Hydrolase n=1 Tax=Mycolicibacterium neworleansense TaxID=146018 RepID=A0A0H5RL20_9MYCO|nr:alpha/beta hydrolase [Mycolicibacterium neworleansense]MCV7363939.1 alpha/beta hydrolase [Mycolicibacterium neworleansense]CRZ14723.1 hydrolase [Mycolicibacterium neworleansense]